MKSKYEKKEKQFTAEDTDKIPWVFYASRFNFCSVFSVVKSCKEELLWIKK